VLATAGAARGRDCGRQSRHHTDTTNHPF